METENDIQTISETVPEDSISKNRRGRPSVLDPDKKALLESAYPSIETARGLQNKLYMTRAIYLLKGHSGFRWLYDPETQTLQETILAELGRIDNVEVLLSAARHICDLKPTSKEAVRAIRRLRLQTEASHEGLT